MQKTRILFVSRAYPPTVGGIENQNFELARWLGKIAEVSLIVNLRGKKFLPLFLPWALLRTLVSFRKFEVLVLGDGVLALLAWTVKLFYPHKPIILVAHGLDLTFPSRLYQKLWVHHFLKKVDKLICVGNETVRVAKEKGMAPEKIVFIPNGVDTDKNIADYDRDNLEKVLGPARNAAHNVAGGEELAGKKVLLTSGRLAKRKGVAWFIENVLPKLPENILYVVAGDGPDRENINKAIESTKAQTRVKMLGYVTDEVRDILFNTCDLFIQPNIKVMGDMEGFGISVIEAASCRLPVVASRLEGLQDAIKDGQNGFLVDPGDGEGYAKKITDLLVDDTYREEFGVQARKFVIANYHWPIIAQRYLEEIEKSLTAVSR